MIQLAGQPEIGRSARVGIASECIGTVARCVPKGRFALAPGFGVEQLAGIAEVDLCFLAGCGFHAHGHIRFEGGKAVQKAIHRRDAAYKAQFTYPFADGGAVNSIPMEVQHHVAVGFDGRGRLGGWGWRQGRGKQRLELLDRQQRPFLLTPTYN